MLFVLELHRFTENSEILHNFQLIRYTTDNFARVIRLNICENKTKPRRYTKPLSLFSEPTWSVSCIFFISYITL